MKSENIAADGTPIENKIEGILVNIAGHNLLMGDDKEKARLVRTVKYLVTQLIINDDSLSHTVSKGILENAYEMLLNK